MAKKIKVHYENFIMVNFSDPHEDECKLAIECETSFCIHAAQATARAICSNPELADFMLDVANFIKEELKDQSINN